MCQNTVFFQRRGRAEPSRFPPMWKVEFRCALACEGAPGLFAPWANCVYYHTFFGLCPVRSGETSRTPIKSIIPRCEKLSPSYVSLFCLSASSHLLAHFARAGEICATCHRLPAWPSDWWNTFSGKVMVTDRVFTSFCVEEKRGNDH